MAGDFLRWTVKSGVIDLEAAPQAVPEIRGVYWLPRNPKIDRALKLLKIAGSLLIIVMLAGGLVMYGWVRMQAGVNPDEELQEQLNLLGFVFLLSGLLLTSLFPLIWQSIKAMEHRLGTDGKQLYIRLNDGREIRARPVELAFTDRAIFYQKYFMPLQTGKGQNLYAEGELQTWIFPLLRQGEKLNPWEGLRHQWKNRDASVSWSLISILALGLLLLVLASKLNL